MSTPLYFTLPLTLATEFVDVEQAALAQSHIRIGTPGTLEDRVTGNHVYTYLRYYDMARHYVSVYVGNAGSPDCLAARAEAQASIDAAEMRVDAVKSLRRLGLACADESTGAVLAALHNHKLFAAGLTLVGSHAFGAIMNKLGVRANAYQTRDVDTSASPRIATGEPLDLLTVLNTSGLPFVKTKGGLSPKSKAESYLVPGQGRMFDVLVDGHHLGKPVHVPGINAYAQAIPHLNFLLHDRMQTVVLSKNLIVPVYVPDPRRFAVHKFFSAMNRVNDPKKTAKDLLQAATVACAVEDNYPGDIAATMQEFPEAGQRVMREGARQAMTLVEKHSEQHAEAFAKAIIGHDGTT